MNHIELFTNTNEKIHAEILIPGSKSITNRIYIINALSGNITRVHNASNSTDSELLLKALQTNNHKVWFKDGATPFRFFLAYAAAKNLHTTLEGDEGLMKRSIADLCDTLTQLGAQFQFANQAGFPPVAIKKGIESFVDCKINANYSSQFGSALMLIAPEFPGIKTIELTGKSVSLPYLEMTANCMESFGIKPIFTENKIAIPDARYTPPSQYTVEADWSGAAFIYALCAVLPGSSFNLPNLFRNSIQGDAVVADIFSTLGVTTQYNPSGVQIHQSNKLDASVEVDFTNIPDLAPAIISTCAFLQIQAKFTGIQHLKNKESDRILSMQENLKQLGIALHCDNTHAWLNQQSFYKPKSTVIPFQSFNDHRIAMAMSMWAAKYHISIENPDCVNKSFPGFWEEIQKCNFVITSGT